MHRCRFCDNPGRFYRTDEPEDDFVAWDAWAEKLSRTHEQLKCPVCGRFTVWRKRSRA